MTVIIGLKQDNEIWIASDRRICCGANKIDAEGLSDSKLVFLKNAVIGAAGDVVIRNHLELYANKKNINKYLFPDKFAVMEFFISFKKFQKTHVEESDQEHSACWILATKDKLFELDEGGSIIEINRLCSIGSGQNLALGSLEILANQSLSPEEILQKTHDVVIKHDITCGGEQIRINVSKLLA